MEARKPILFIKPLSKSLERLLEQVKEMKDSESLDIFEMNQLEEVSQSFQSLGPSFTILSSPKKCAMLLTAQKNYIKAHNCKIILLSPKSIPNKIIQRLEKLGLTECIIEPVPDKTLFYKAKIHIKSINILALKEKKAEQKATQKDINSLKNKMRVIKDEKTQVDESSTNPNSLKNEMKTVEEKNPEVDQSDYHLDSLKKEMRALREESLEVNESDHHLDSLKKETRTIKETTKVEDKFNNLQASSCPVDKITGNMVGKSSYQEEKLGRMIGKINDKSNLGAKMSGRSTQVNNLGGAMSGKDSPADNLDGSMSGNNSPADNLDGSMSGNNSPADNLDGSMSGNNSPADNLDGSMSGNNSPADNLDGSMSGKSNTEQLSGQLTGDVEKEKLQRPAPKASDTLQKEEKEEKEEKEKKEKKEKQAPIASYALQKKKKEKQAPIASYALEKKKKEKQAPIASYALEKKKKEKHAENSNNEIATKAITINPLEDGSDLATETLEKLQNTIIDADPNQLENQSDGIKKDHNNELGYSLKKEEENHNQAENKVLKKPVSLIDTKEDNTKVQVINDNDLEPSKKIALNKMDIEETYSRKNKSNEKIRDDLISQQEIIVAAPNGLDNLIDVYSFYFDKAKTTQDIFQHIAKYINEITPAKMICNQTIYNKEKELLYKSGFTESEQKDLINLNKAKWEKSSLPFWYDQTFQAETNTLLFPFYSGITSLGYVYIEFSMLMTKETSTQVEVTLEGARGLYLELLDKKEGKIKSSGFNLNPFKKAS
jgi:hypothetical protein